MREGVVIIAPRDGRLLVIQRAAHIFAGGAWCFPGGGIEPGESQAEAVVREFREEVHGHVRPIRKIWQYVRPDGRLRLHWWLSELLPGRLHANPDEVAQLRWCRPDEIQHLPNLLDSNLAFMREVGHDLMAHLDDESAA